MCKQHALTKIAGLFFLLMWLGPLPGPSLAPTFAQADASNAKIRALKKRLKAINKRLKQQSTLAVPEIYKKLLREKKRLKKNIARLRRKSSRQTPPKPRRRLSRHQLMMMWSVPGMGRGMPRRQPPPQERKVPTGNTPEDSKKLNDIQNDAFEQEKRRLRKEKQLAAKKAAKIALREKMRQQARTLYSKGQLHKSRALFLKIGATDSALHIKKFTSCFRTGKRAHDQINPSIAISWLKRALQHDRTLCNKGSIYTPKIQRMLANMYVSRAVYAQGQRRFTSAYIYLRSARTYHPKHPMIKAQLKRIAKIALSYVDQAKKFRKNKRLARKLLRKAIAITDKGSAVSITARRLLSEYAD